MTTISTQTEAAPAHVPTVVRTPSPLTKPDVEDSMRVFLDKLDTLCDKLSTVDKGPVTRGPCVSVHNHKTQVRLCFLLEVLLIILSIIYRVVSLHQTISRTRPSLPMTMMGSRWSEDSSRTVSYWKEKRGVYPLLTPNCYHLWRR